jgi:hypothetical protein
MEALLELKTTIERPEIIIDDTIDDRIMFTEKLQTVKDKLEKHPIPAWIFLSRYSTIQQEEGICVRGVLQRADTASNTLVVAVIVNEYAQSNYHIRTIPETLTQIVKNYWNETINVQIRPQINKDNQFEYELMTVKVVD